MQKTISAEVSFLVYSPRCAKEQECNNRCFGLFTNMCKRTRVQQPLFWFIHQHVQKNKSATTAVLVYSPTCAKEQECNSCCLSVFTNMCKRTRVQQLLFWFIHQHVQKNKSATAAVLVYSPTCAKEQECSSCCFGLFTNMSKPT